MNKEKKELKPERLIGRTETAARLNMKPRSFTRHKAKLIAQGLQEVQMGNSKSYREASIDRIIAKAAEKGIPLFGKVQKWT